MISQITKKATLIAGLSIVAMSAGATANAFTYMDDDDKVVEEKAKAKKYKKTIKVIKPGKPAAVKTYTTSDPHVIIGEDGSQKIIVSTASSPNIHFRQSGVVHHQNQEAIAKLEEALEKVESRLKKTKKKADKEALKAARDGLIAAKEALVQQAVSVQVVGAEHKWVMERAHKEALHEALEDVIEQEGELSEMRIEVIEDMVDARADLAEALAELEVEVQAGDDANVVYDYQVRTLKDAEFELENIEKHQLEAIKKAEEELKRTREHLERELEKKERAKQKAKKKENKK